MSEYSSDSATGEKENEIPEGRTEIGNQWKLMEIIAKTGLF